MNIDHLSKMVDYRPMVDNIDPVAGLQERSGQFNLIVKSSDNLVLGLASVRREQGALIIMNLTNGGLATVGLNANKLCKQQCTYSHRHPLQYNHHHRHYHRQDGTYGGSIAKSPILSSYTFTQKCHTLIKKGVKKIFLGQSPKLWVGGVKCPKIQVKFWINMFIY